MSDEHGTRDDSASAVAARAAAASRARRIGGRAPRPGPGGGTGRVSEPPRVATPPQPPRPGTTAEPPPVVAVPEPAGVETAPEPAASAQPQPSFFSQSLRAWLPAIVLGVAALVFAVLIAVTAASGTTSHSGQQPNTALREQVLAAAKQCAAQANTYDYRTLAQSEAKAAACTTGAYRTQNQNAFEKVIKKYAPKLHATQSAQINTAGIENVSEDGKTWTVLLFGQLVQTNNTTAKQGRYDPQAIQVVMKNVGGTWLVSALNGA
jgi:hypothetical protein